MNMWMAVVKCLLCFFSVFFGGGRGDSSRYSDLEVAEWLGKSSW